MANARSKNTIFIDSTGDISVDAVKPKLRGILFTPTGTSGRFVLKHNSSAGTTIIDIRSTDIQTDGSQWIWFGEGGIDLSSTVNANVVTNCVVMLYGEFLVQT